MSLSIPVLRAVFSSGEPFLRFVLVYCANAGQHSLCVGPNNAVITLKVLADKHIKITFAGSIRGDAGLEITLN